ncbi:hypothetical protein EJ02DRAFT_449598 [Clathrospora elynae]|uniref:Pathway-specific nitrogen regulator n=1 Tax=Clathrospora elynae TaxID=706981 RepID=A0A6A5T4A4_9PLEO|nr:hypothetical protein EJ02DRAFT_449598 [Clathrospora elynae]
MTTVHHSSPQPGLTSFAIYQGAEDRVPISPIDMYEGEESYLSEPSFPMADEAVPCIELQQEPEDEPQPYRGSYTSRKSGSSLGSQPRRSSQYSFISGMPSESSMSSKPMLPANEAGARSRKERPRFRNPESVRAMQMASPPPMPAYEASRERVKGSYKLATPSRSERSETSVSRRSGSRRRSIREHHSPRPTPTPTPQQAPLVLLHVTILPMQVPYAHDLMARIMPDWLVENYKLLEEKLQDIILMRRGLLIPHPGDEYELLEERILESLELKTPRLLKCGHFVPPEDDSDREDEDDVASVSDENTGRGSRMSGGTLTEGSKWEETMSAIEDHSMCIDCHRQLKKPGKGVGAGTRKWDIKIYAANGLMRAGAWAACFNDMERCDVEIHPWIPEEVRKTLERRALEEQEADKRKQKYAVELQRQIQESAAKTKILEEEAAERKKADEAELQKSFEAAAAALQRSVEEKAAEKKKFEEDLEVKLEEAKEAVRLALEVQVLAESTAISERFRALEDALKQQKKAETEPGVIPTSRQPRPAQIPLGTLLKNYLLVLLGDQRNFIILLLSAVVIYLAMNMENTTWKQQPLSTQLMELPSDFASSESVSTNAVMATTTTTSFLTLTVTETQTAISMYETALPFLDAAELELKTALSSMSVSPSAEEEAEVSAVEELEEVLLAPESNEALPTSPAVELVKSSDNAMIVVESKTDDAELERVELPVPEAHIADKWPIVEIGQHADVCVLEPVFDAPNAICAKDEQ